MPNATQEGVIHKVDTAKYFSITCDEVHILLEKS
jgi:hypothetical protein